MTERPQFLSKLEREFAILRGKFNDAERTVETVIGLHAIREKWIEIESTKVLLKRKMDQIEGTIRQFDPTFDVERVKPIRPTARRARAQGSISRTALASLRAAGRPMTATELAKAVAATLGLEEPDHRAISRLASVIHTSFDRYVLRGRLKLAGENPKRWAPAGASSRGAVSADAHRDAASSPSNPEKSAA